MRRSVELRRLRLINGSYDGSVSNNDKRPSIQNAPHYFKFRLFVRGFVFLVVALGLALFVHALFLLILAVWLLTEYVVANRIKFNRSMLFERDYPAFLLSLCTSIRTGIDPLSALFACGNVFSPNSVIHSEISSVERAVNLGQSEESAIRFFGSSVCHPDVELFRSAFILARREGSSLAPCLQRLARVTRSRQSFRRKIRAAVAMQRLSAFGIAGCTVVIALIQVSTNPQALRDAIAHPVGVWILGAALASIFAGLAWMLCMSRMRV